MEFAFTADQRLLQQTVRDFLVGACPVARLRALWDTDTGRSPELWSELAEIGLPGLLVPEAQGGLGLSEIDMVLLLEETGRAALAEPMIATAAVGAKLLVASGSSVLRESWLPRVAAGDALLAVGHPINAFTADAHVADLLLLVSRSAGVTEIHAVAPDRVRLTAQPANDPARRIFGVEWAPADDTRIAAGDAGAALADAALDGGALACAAELLGVADRLVELAVRYATERRQFGVPIGSFQAVKHRLADVKVSLEYARSVVYRAAYSVATEAPARGVHASMAKIAAGEAAAEAAKAALQVHGAIGYTWEQDLHVWMRRAWSLGLAWGDASWHRARVAAAVIDRAEPAPTFGYQSPT